MKLFEEVAKEIVSRTNEWETQLALLTEEQISIPRNSQNRNIRQILGHLVDSASNNIHRVVHLQYRESPLEFPNYASYGNNDKWIAIQNYEKENWQNLVQLWKYSNLHFAHIIANINPEKLKNQWMADTGKFISLEEMVIDYNRHLNLHIIEIEELLNEY